MNKRPLVEESTAPGASASAVPNDDYLRSIVDFSRVAMAAFDLEGRVEFINRLGLELFEIADFDQVRGRRVASFWPEELRPQVESAFVAAAEGRTGRFRGLGPRVGGALTWWDATVSPVFDEAGRVVRLTAHIHDVTAEVEAKAFLDAVVEHVPTMLFAKTAEEGRFVLINRAAEEVFGHPREEMLGKTDYDFFPKEQADFFRGRDAEVIRSRRVHLIEEEPVTTAAGLRWFRTRKTAMYGPEGPCHLLVVAEDVTERKQAEEALKAALVSAEAASRAKSEFLANMSHELRTPLNGVVGVAELLSAADLSPSHRAMLDMIRESGQALERILSDVLDVAGIDAGRVEIRSDAFDLGDLLQGVAGVFELRARDKGLKLRLAVAAASGRRVTGDAVRLKQILGALLGNAVKFTEQGEVVFSAEPADDGSWRFVVADTGIGFDPAAKAALFGRFQQADGSITRRFGGAGLGLAIARELAERMGGTIDCDSRPGQGSSFVLTIPMPDAQAPVAAVPEPLAEPECAGPLRVLVVDDCAANRTVMGLILEQIGAEVRSAEDGQEGCDLFEAMWFDVVLMDMQMPVMDGLAATRRLREIEARDGRGRTPILMVTANALPEHVQASLSAGADRHLAKPVQPRVLLKSISEVMEEADSAHEAVRACGS